MSLDSSITDRLSISERNYGVICRPAVVQRLVESTSSMFNFEGVLFPDAPLTSVRRCIFRPFVSSAIPSVRYLEISRYLRYVIHKKFVYYCICNNFLH